ncbi:universal stress protein [Alkalilimnicola ehrlichii MLHE-1]|uniref:UspA domain protein n=1 Tax=Alkalilimnicola ehrlichii (strain ATCC BAA-1101 / DSM 17681 / MLHE-1) TaxID=187272 RepID=Q0A8H2_ALKEH|nr:universal stress protein [Alkalilimnicola ehrlichii]ABI56865.1 UspA domain protein [Alkalilimnicola ehrlichii MLHE-1]
MSERRQPGRERQRLFRQALVLLDASLSSNEALQAALGLFARGEVALRGLYVEDRDLLRSAALPFTREVGGYSGVCRPLASDTLEARLRDRAQLIRTVLKRVARDYHHHLELEVTRDRVVSAALSLVRDNDLLVIGRTGWASGQARALGSNARQLVRLAPCSLLIGTWPEQPITAVIVRADEQAEAALRVALSVVGNRARALNVLVLPPEGGPVTDARLGEIAEWLEDQGVSAHLRVVYPPDENGLLRALLQEQTGAVVITRNAHETQADREMVSRLLERVDLPLLLLRWDTAEEAAER